MDWTRRKFLRTVAGASVAVFCPKLARAASRPDLLVVGAGLSGLAAAREVAAAGGHVVVLEAAPRVGGRMRVSRLGGVVPVDEGAMWIHGWRGNPLTSLAQSQGIARRAFDWDSRWTADAAGQTIGSAEVEQGRRLFAGALRSARQWADKLPQDAALGEGLRAFAERENLRGGAASLLAEEIHSSITLEYAAEPGELSAWWWDEGKEFGGGDSLVSGGLGGLATAAAEGLDVRTGAEVVEIGTRDGSPYVVTRDGISRAAGAVLVTLPLGVLQAGAVKFVPLWPQRKTVAMHRLGFGVLQKVFLLFDHSVPLPQEQYWRIVGGDADFAWSDWCNLSSFTGHPVLMAMHATDTARQIERMSDRQTLIAATGALRRVFGRSFPEPRAIISTRWGVDPLARGAYSFAAVGSGPEDRRALGEPLPGGIYFAGEAMSVDYPATAHGAWLSGRAAARQILAAG